MVDETGAFRNEGIMQLLKFLLGLYQAFLGAMRGIIVDDNDLKVGLILGQDD